METSAARFINRNLYYITYADCIHPIIAEVLPTYPNTWRRQEACHKALMAHVIIFHNALSIESELAGGLKSDEVKGTGEGLVDSEILELRT